MVIYPAVDIRNGKCVRLSQGKFDDMTVYSDNPVDMAVKWKDMGAGNLHVVDLDGARCGQPVNMDVIEEITASTGIFVQVGGGIRSIDAVQKIFAAGASRIILGTSAVQSPKLVEEALDRFGDRIAIGIDARDGLVAVEGWEKTSEFSAVSFARKMCEMGVKTIIYTDISRDGMLSGPNLAAMSQMVDSVDADIIASGGIGRSKDITDLKKTGVSGAIIGKALYTGAVDLKEALELAKI